MSVDENVIKLILDMGNSAATADALRASVESLRERMENLVSGHRDGEVSAAALDAGLKKLGGEYGKQRELLAALESAQVGAAAAQKKAAATAYEFADAYDLVERAEVKAAAAGKAEAAAVVTATDAQKRAAKAAADLAAAEAAVAKGAAASAADLAGLRARLDAAEAEARALSAALVSGKINLDQYRAGLQKINDTAAPLRAASQALVGARNNMASLGQAGLQTGRVIQDFAQGGIGGVLNNIEGFAMAVGGGPGLAGALTALGVAAFIAKPYIVSAGESIGLFKDEADAATGHLGRLEKRLEELKKKDVKLSIDHREIEVAERAIEELKKGLAGLKAAQGGKNQFEKESGQQVAGILAEESQGGEKLAVTKALSAEMDERLKASQELKNLAAEVARAEASAAFLARTGAPGGAITREVGKAEAAREQIKSVKAGIAKDAAAEVGGAFAGAKEGDAGKQKRLAELLRKSGQNDLAESIEANSPEATKADSDQEAEFERRMELAKAAGQRRREAATAAKAKEREQEQAGQMKERLKEQAETKARTERERAEREKEREGQMKERLKEQAAAKAKKDRHSLETGLGDGFMARAETSRLAIDTDPGLTEGQRSRQRAALDANITRQAETQLRGSKDPEVKARAGELARQAPGLVREDIQGKIDQARGALNAPQAPPQQVEALILQLIAGSNQVGRQSGGFSQQFTASLQRLAQEQQQVISRNQGGVTNQIIGSPY